MKISRSITTYSTVILISLLLMFNLTLLIQNFNIIYTNTIIKKKAENIMVETGEVIRAVHLMDLGIRGFALDNKIESTFLYDTAIKHLDTAFVHLESSLEHQGFPMRIFFAFKDSVYHYTNLGEKMIALLKAGKRTNFMEIYAQDYGYQTWLDYLNFRSRIIPFEDQIYQEADQKYRDAIKNNIMASVILMLLIIPTLFYMTYRSNRARFVSEKLRRSEWEKNEILKSHNQKLERMVRERTEEIQTQNEEISAQNDELSDANHLIEMQNKVIQDKNAALKKEVNNQTDKLIRANKELIERVSKMEQYAFIVSHNLRSPVAQILGLSNLTHYTDDPQQLKEILQYISEATEKLDIILKDLNQILIIENATEKPIKSMFLDECIQQSMQNLESEIEKNHIQIKVHLKINRIETIEAYMLSIFFNLISNAVKYRNPKVQLEINIQSFIENDQLVISISDNGLGIDLEKYGHDIFNLYRRFHTHVQGRGLGLYLTKIQVENLGGHIEVSSKLKGGTTFLIYLPHRLVTESVK